MANIKTYLNNIKTAVFGSEVRDSIHDAIQQCYDDASAKDNANMEVKMARGEYENLGKRLDSHSSQIKDIVKKKATKDEVAIERARIDAFTSLNEGTTTGDAELIDGRIGVDGTTYNNIGNAIRNQVNGLSSALQTGVAPFVLTDWENNLWGEYGNTFMSSSKYHTFMDGETIIINCQDGFEYGYRSYDSEGEIVDTIWFLEGKSYIVVDGNLRYKFVIRKKDLSQATPDIVNNLSFEITYPIVKSKELENVTIYSENYFNSDTIYDNYAINLNESNLGKKFEDIVTQNYNTDYFQSDLIPVEYGDEFTLYYPEGFRCGFTQINFFGVYYFDKNKMLISYSPSAITGLIQVSNNKVKYVAFSCNKSYYKHIDAYILVKGRDNPNRYIPYKRTLKLYDKPLALEDDLFSWKGKKVISYGDSITQFGHWQSRVRDYFKFNHINQGCSGARISKSDNAGKWWINADGSTNTSLDNSPNNPGNCTLVNGYFCSQDRIDMIPQDVDCILFMGGTNDMANNVPLGEVGFDDETTFKGATCIALKRIMERCPNAVIIVITLLNGKSMTSNVNLDGYATNALGLTTKDYCDATIECAEYMAVPYINLHDTCMINPFNRSKYMRDNDHPTYGVENAGATRISRVIIGAMKHIEPNVYDSYLY